MPLTDQIITAVILIALAVVMLAPIACSIFFWRVHGLDPNEPKLWLPRTLAVASTAWSLPTVYLGVIAMIRTTAGLEGVPPWTAPITTGAVMVMGGACVYLLWSFLRNT